MRSRKRRRYVVQLDAVAQICVEVYAEDGQQAGEYGAERISDLLYEAERLIEDANLPITLIEGDEHYTVDQEDGDV